MKRVKDIFRETNLKMEEERKRKNLWVKTLRKTGIPALIVVLLLTVSLTPTASAQTSPPTWIYDGVDSNGDHVVAGSYMTMPQENTDGAKAFIEIEAKYTVSYQWWGIQYKAPTNIDVRIYMDKGVNYLYTNTNRQGHYYISDAWSNPKDDWNVGGRKVGFIGHTVTLPSFYSVDNIMLNHPKNNEHWSYGGDVKWYFSTYNIATAIESFMGTEKWFGGDQGYYFIGGKGTPVTYHFHAAVKYTTFAAPYWNPSQLMVTGQQWVSSNIHAYDSAGIKIGSNFFYLFILYPPEVLMDVHQI